MTDIPGDIWAALWIILGAAGAFLARQFWPYLSSLWSQDAESRRRQAEQRASLAVDEEEHRQNADNEVRHAYFMLGQSLLAEQRRANEQSAAIIQHSMDALVAEMRRIGEVGDAQMRAQVAMQFEIAELRRDGRMTSERAARIETLLATFGPPYAQGGERPWEKQEADRNE